VFNYTGKTGKFTTNLLLHSWIAGLSGMIRRALARIGRSRLEIL
jgi:hypothetical protein